MTKWPDLFNALAAPFDTHEVKVRSQAGRQFHYITARTVMNRLDDVLGPEAWWDEYVPSENSVLCRLTIRLPDGTTLTKADAGGYAGMSDSGDDDKSGYSDAFKRAAVKFGVARYLYRDGVATFVPEAQAAPAPVVANPAPPPTRPGKAPRSYWQLVVDATGRRNDLHGESISPADVHWMLAVLADAEGRSPLPTADHVAASLKAAETFEPAWVVKQLVDFVGRKVTPRHLDEMYHYERTDVPLDPGVTFEQFLDFETRASGRGESGSALAFLRDKIGKTHPDFEQAFARPEGRPAVLSALREYLGLHPCTLPPLHPQETTPCQPTSTSRPRTSRA